MSGTEEMLDTSRSVRSFQAPVDRHAEAENGHNFDGPKLTSRMSFSQNCGELNIPQIEPPGNNSARIAYSGILSNRSDSIATSARSFAFPILQSEWNSSPIKMAKADRRRYRKHCGSYVPYWHAVKYMPILAYIKQVMFPIGMLLSTCQYWHT